MVLVIDIGIDIEMDEKSQKMFGFPSLPFCGPRVCVDACDGM